MKENDGARARTGFASVLVRLRREQGFATAHAFYKARGGRRAFGVAFTNYLGLERGRSLPRGRRLEGLVAALGLEPASRAAKELVLAYMRDALGSEALVRPFEAPPATDPAPPGWRIAENAARQALGGRSVRLTPEQYALLARDEATYACHVVLANTRGWIETKELSRMLDLSPADLRRRLTLLSGAALAQVRGGKARSPLAGQYIMPPLPTPAVDFSFSRLRRHRDEWVRGRGRSVHQTYLILRAPEPKFRDYLAHLSDVVAMSALYGDVEQGAASGVYLVEGKVTRLFDPNAGR
ncbi:MAG: hypothetical protein NUW21_06775 [Elusimicrobia bacterium]|nr:hypothetical protein [Elusimicrobiota bacterium]